MKRIYTFLLLFVLFGALPLPGFAAEHETILKEVRDRLISIQEILDASRPQVLDSSVNASFTNTLTVGSTDATTGGQVSKLQAFLKLTGDFTFDSITGYFGPITEEAVKRFQARQNIVAGGAPSTTGYGLVGPKTRAALNAYAGVQQGQTTTQSSSGGDTVTVMTINIAGANTDVYGDPTAMISALANYIKAHQIQIVALQEVDRGTNRHDGVDIYTALGTKLGQIGWSMDKRWVKRFNVDGGEFGNALFSRLPITDHDTYSLTHDGGLQSIEITRSDGAEFRVFNYHPYPQYACTNINEVEDIVDDYSSDMTLLLGDFNADVTQCLDDVLDTYRNACDEGGSETCDDTINNEYHGGDNDRAIDFVFVRRGTKDPFVTPWDVLTTSSDHNINAATPITDHYPVLSAFSYTLENVEPPEVHPTLTVLAPNGGENWKIGSTRTVRWSSVDIPSSNTVEIYLKALYSGPDVIITSGTLNDGIENVTVPNVQGTYYLAAATTVGTTGVSDTSNGTITVSDDGGSTYITPCTDAPKPLLEVSEACQLVPQYTDNDKCVDEWKLVCKDTDGGGTTVTDPPQTDDEVKSDDSTTTDEEKKTNTLFDAAVYKAVEELIDILNNVL